MRTQVVEFVATVIDALEDGRIDAGEAKAILVDAIGILFGEGLLVTLRGALERLAHPDHERRATRLEARAARLLARAAEIRG